MKIPKSLAKELKVAGIASEKKVNEIISSLAAAAEYAHSKEAISSIQTAIKELRLYQMATAEAFQRVDSILANPYEYDVEIVRGDDGFAERFIMRPHRGAIH